VTRYALVLLADDDSILLRDGTWITFARLLAWRVRPVDVRLFRSRRAASAVRRSWRGRPDIVVVSVYGRAFASRSLKSAKSSIYRARSRAISLQ